jgi:DNA polymerase III subunit gamma/tau
MPVLYRKYRPQRFAEVVGQAPIVRTLRNAAQSGTVAHAYLFTGSRGVGKTTVARLLAKAINCLNPKDGDVCNTCEICQAMSAGNFLDLIEIDAASNTGVENVRELIEHVRFKPARGQYKVFIIDEVHMLSKAAFNALLKTLEEPPAHAVFILATTDIHKVPETIISRTQRFDFKKIGQTEIVQQLKYVAEQEQLIISPDILELVARSAQGGLRDALSLLDKVTALGPEAELSEVQLLLGLTSLKTSQDLVDLMASHNTSAIPERFDELLNSGTDFAVFNRDLLEYLRKMLVYKIAGENAPIDLLPEDKQVLVQQVGRLSVGELMHLIRLFLRSYKDLAAAPTPELPMLLAAVEAAYKNTAGSTEARGQGVVSSGPQILQTEVMAEITPVVMVAQDQIVDAITDPINRSEVEAIWPQVIEKIKAINSPLATLIKNSPLQEVEGSTVTIAVKYLFHKEHLESKKNYSLITKIMEECCGKPVRLSVKIKREQRETVMAEATDVLGDALKVFGGELVE